MQARNANGSLPTARTPKKHAPKNVPRKDAPKNLFLTHRFPCKRDSAARAFQKTDMRQVVAKMVGPGTGGAEGMVEYAPKKGCPLKYTKNIELKGHPEKKG